MRQYGSVRGAVSDDRPYRDFGLKSRKNRRGLRRRSSDLVHAFSETALGKRGPAGRLLGYCGSIGEERYGPILGTLPRSDRGHLRLFGSYRFECFRSEKEALRAASWGIVVPLGRSGMDQFSEHYQDLIEGIYDCSDRIVLNAYFPMGQAPGGMLVWWRALYGGDEDMDTAHLMRMAGRFSRRVRAFAEAKGIPIVDCAPKVKKFEIAQADLCKHDGRPGVFLILVAKSRAPVWEVERTKSGKVGAIRRKEPMPFVNHYSFHIWDAEWGHVTIKMSGHPPFGAQIILNGHDYVSRSEEHTSELQSL